MSCLSSAVSVRPMALHEFNKWRDEVVYLYAKQAAEALGGKPGDYLEEAERHTKAELPDGLKSAGQEICVIEVDGEAAGSLWVTIDVEHARAFIVSLEVSPVYRMQGVGLHALRSVEDYLKDKDILVVRAHLFDVNRPLVDRLAREGYECKEYVVEKRL